MGNMVCLTKKEAMEHQLIRSKDLAAKYGTECVRTYQEIQIAQDFARKKRHVDVALS
jgi:hypothetical protein